MTEQEAVRAIEDFGDAARRTRDSGFDGVQIHGAHGYLIHQFLLPSINNRRDRFGIDPSTGIGTAFLGAVLDNVRKKCGEDYPILLKVSGGDDYLKKFTPSMFTNHIKFIDMKGVDAIEVSYGTMDYALNIFRGATLPVDTILKYNPKYKTTNPLLKTLFKGLVFPLVSTRFKPLTTAYNLPYSRAVKAITQIPVITVGGFRTGTEISEALENSQTDFVSLCRPFIREPDFLVKLTTDPLYRSLCTGCNKCAIMCDSKFSTRCYSKNHNERVKAAGDPAKEISHGS
jgi:2,4-dienoyl-CoA reductase-like NADH-dependent reductase (Old Yellow Enzyme family)